MGPTPGTRSGLLSHLRWTGALPCTRPCAGHGGHSWSPTGLPEGSQPTVLWEQQGTLARAGGGWLLEEPARKRAGDRKVLRGGNAGAKALRQEPPSRMEENHKVWCGWSREGKPGSRRGREDRGWDHKEPQGHGEGSVLDSRGDRTQGRSEPLCWLPRWALSLAKCHRG